ncbi:MAG: molecular chaperone TorD family protein, partial [Chloroflexi bacterium]|nr:molecular chaperone TorD family protein [Chloroflexota bacterium]
VARAFHERPDHVAAELEFMHVAALQEARALARGQTEKAEVCRDAQAKFLADHLACWLPAYAERLRREDGEGFYAALGGLAVAFVAADGRRLGVEAARARRFRPAKPQPDFECPAGGGEGCAPS